MSDGVLETFSLKMSDGSSKEVVFSKEFRDFMKLDLDLLSKVKNQLVVTRWLLILLVLIFLASLIILLLLVTQTGLIGKYIGAGLCKVVG